MVFIWGGISLSIFYFFKNRLDTLVFNVLVFCVWALFVVLNYDGDMRFPRPIGASLPYLYAGFLLKKYEQQIKCLNRKIFILLLTCVICLYIETYIMMSCSYSRLFLLPTSVLTFILILRLDTPSWIVKYLSYIPAHLTLSVYIWHRLVYCLMAGVLSINMYGVDAIFVFVITAFLAFLFGSFRRTDIMNKNKRSYFN